MAQSRRLCWAGSTGAFWRNAIASSFSKEWSHAQKRYARRADGAHQDGNAGAAFGNMIAC